VVWLLIHLPHLMPPVLAFGFLARIGVWAAGQPPQHYSDAEVDAWMAERAAQRAARHQPVARRAALLGVAALLPLIVAFGTGLAIYTWNLRSDRPSAVLVWVHTAAAVVGVGLASAKVVTIGLRRVRARITPSRPHEALGSTILALLGVPLLATGIWLLVAPSGRSFGDYTHLIVSVWWTLILQVHLFRYLGRALSASFGSRAAVSPPATTARTGS
jgi:hypothetical protein